MQTVAVLGTAPCKRVLREVYVGGLVIFVLYSRKRKNPKISQVQERCQKMSLKRERAFFQCCHECLLFMKVSFVDHILFTVYIEKVYVRIFINVCLSVKSSMYLCFLCDFFSEPHKFQLWVYVYQGRDLLAMDDTGQSGENHGYRP